MDYGKLIRAIACLVASYALPLALTTKWKVKRP